jgi:hypothetical protein
MATVKKILGDYTIQSVGTQSNVNINTNTLTVNGNMVVHGATTTIQSTNTAVYDNQVELNANLSTTASPLPILSGITVNRGSGHVAQLVWNELIPAWQISIPNEEPSDTLGTIAIMNLDGLRITANLDLKQYAIYTSVFQQLAIDSNLAIKNTTVAPFPLANYNTIYTTTPAATNTRDSGVFVTNTTKQGAQLSTKNQALLYSLIFF